MRWSKYNITHQWVSDKIQCQSSGKTLRSATRRKPIMLTSTVHITNTGIPQTRAQSRSHCHQPVSWASANVMRHKASVTREKGEITIICSCYDLYAQKIQKNQSRLLELKGIQPRARIGWIHYLPTVTRKQAVEVTEPGTPGYPYEIMQTPYIKGELERQKETCMCREAWVFLGQKNGKLNICQFSRS